MRFHFILWIFIAAFISPAYLEAQTGKATTALNTANTEAVGDKSTDLKTPEDFYAAGKYSEAAKLFLRTERSRRNRLTAYYNAARSLHQDYIDNQSLESLSAAVEGYYRVLDLNPEHHETLINLELARLELEKHDNAAESQDSDSQKDGQGQNDQKDDLNKLAEEQKDLADSNNGQDNIKENSEKQSSLTERTEQARDQSEQNSQTRERLDQALEKQNEAMEQMNQGFEEEAREAQQDAASLLEQAAQSVSESQNQDDSESLPQDIQSILNQEQSRKQDKQDAEDMIRVEKNW
jgi:hypothetical protein